MTDGTVSVETLGQGNITHSWAALAPNTAYSARVAMLNRSTTDPSVEGQAPFSDPVFFTTLLAGQFSECIGSYGSISSGIPSKNSNVTWNIRPRAEFLSPLKGRSWAITLLFTHFDLECDYDLVTVTADYTDGTRRLWSGGCHRETQFSITGDTLRNVSITLSTDNSFDYSGFSVDFTVEETLALEVTSSSNILPSPRPAMAACPGAIPCSGGLKGSCNQRSSCTCYPGWLGEDCSQPLFCPKPPLPPQPENDHLCIEPVLSSLAKLVAVSPFGDDVEAAITGGTVGDQFSGGRGEKPYRTLAVAIEKARLTGATVVVFPGVFAGVGNVNLLIDSVVRFVPHLCLVTLLCVLSSRVHCLWFRQDRGRPRPHGNCD
jgi:hypothetical protein